MSGDNSTQKLLEEMKKQMSKLQGQVERMQRAVTFTSLEEPGEEDLTTGELEELSEQTRSFLEATAFSATLSNADHKKRIANIGIPDCDKIHCQKLDPMLTILPKDAIKVDGYLSHLQQFWLDAIAPLAAILEGAKAGELTPEYAYSAAQAALVLMGNANNHMVQERRKRILMNVNPALKSMANKENAFQQADPMLFGEEFAKKATDRVEAIKAIKKISYQKPGEKCPGCFFRVPPPEPSRWPQGWLQKRPWEIPALPEDRRGSDGIKQPRTEPRTQNN